MAEGDTRWHLVARLDELAATRKRVCHVEGRELLLVKSGSEVLAVDNHCTHLGESLERGRVMSGQITCPFHGACFDLRTGEALSGPAVRPLRC